MLFPFLLNGATGRTNSDHPKEDRPPPARVVEGEVCPSCSRTFTQETMGSEVPMFKTLFASRVPDLNLFGKTTLVRETHSSGLSFFVANPHKKLVFGDFCSSICPIESQILRDRVKLKGEMWRALLAGCFVLLYIL